MFVVEGLIVLIVLVGVYFIPTMVALDRKVPSAWSIIVVNVFLGWTLVGWVVALAMAVRSVPTPAPTVAARPAPALVPEARGKPVNPMRAQRACPACGVKMAPDKITCPSCGAESDPWTFRDGTWWSQPRPGVWSRLDPLTGRWRTEGEASTEITSTVE